MRVDIFEQSRGVGRLTVIVFGTIVGASLFCAYNILPFYYYYYELVNQMEAVTKVASVETDQEIRQRLMYHIKKMEIPADPEDLKIERDGNIMRISLPYEEVFYVNFGGKEYEIYRFPFHAYVEKQF